MASPKLSNQDRFLRLATIFTFVLNVAFLVPYGVESRRTVVPVAIVPAGISAMTALYHFSGLAVHRAFNILLDACVAIYLLAMFIAATTTIAGYWKLKILGTYGTIPLIVAFAIHVFFVLRDTNILELCRYHISALVEEPRCPHCQHKVLSVWGMSESRAPSSMSSRHSYAALQPAADEEREEAEPLCRSDHETVEYKDAEPRTDADETARLV